jgi:hypothetical protein
MALSPLNRWAGVRGGGLQPVLTAVKSEGRPGRDALSDQRHLTDERQRLPTQRAYAVLPSYIDPDVRSHCACSPLSSAFVIPTLSYRPS